MDISVIDNDSPPEPAKALDNADIPTINPTTTININPNTTNFFLRKFASGDN